MEPETALAALLDMGEIRAYAPTGSPQAIRWAGAKHGRAWDWFVDIGGCFQGLTDEGVSELHAGTLELRSV